MNNVVLTVIDLKKQVELTLSLSEVINMLPLSTVTIHFSSNRFKEEETAQLKADP